MPRLHRERANHASSFSLALKPTLIGRRRIDRFPSPSQTVPPQTGTMPARLGLPIFEPFTGFSDEQALRAEAKD
ncbi:MAG TPA: hypothetical protein VGK96_20045 [Candidatus Sulfotelmatobacter sp.]|jgi:hypothetical protein